MKKVLFRGFAVLFLLSLFVAPAYAQADASTGLVGALSTEAIALAIAAAGCGYAQSKAVTAGCEGVSRNPGASDSVRFFIILGLAFIEFLALLTFVFLLLKNTLFVS